MDRSVIIRSGQQLTAGDGNNIQEFIRAGIARLIQDGFGGAGYYTGFEVGKSDAWKVQMPEGRLYVGGQAYSKRSDTVLDFYGERPFGQRKIVTIIARGEPVDSDEQPRKFLTNVTTRQTEVQPVAMLRTETVLIERRVSAEAAVPIAPQAPVGTVKIAEIELTTGGVGIITMWRGTYLPNAAFLASELDALQVWKGQLEVSVGRIQTDLYTLARALLNYTPLDDFRGLREELAITRRIADRALALASEQPFLLDYIEAFDSAAQSDTEADGYAVRLTDEGLQFPRIEEVVAGGIQLQNPNEPKVSIVDNIITPKATARVALDNAAGFSGSVSLLAYATTTQTVQYRTGTRRVLVSGGGTRSYEATYANGMSSHNNADNVGFNAGGSAVKISDNGSTSTYRVTVSEKPRYKTVSYREAYTTTATETIPAQGRAQTLIMSSGGRLKDITLYFDQVDDAGDVRVMICRADGNNPNQADVVAQTIIPFASLKVGAVNAPLPPDYLNPGERYSINILSNGNHKIRLSSQPRSITQGEHFAYNGDNVYIRPSTEADRDIAVTLNFQQYDSTKIEVDLQPISMAGGMDGIQIEGIVDEPAGTDAYFEIQIGGVWQSLDIVGGQRIQADFSTRPPLVPFRIVFEGTLDKMPSCAIGGEMTALKPFRDAETVKHVSDEMDVGGGNTASKIKLTALLAYYIEEQADCTLSLIVGGAPIAASSVEDVKFNDTGEISRTAIFDLAVPTQTYQAVIEGAAIDTHERFIVENLKHYARA